jgi:hypothetical protein
VAVARLGGFIGRKSDGMPGWQTIWRGWQRLMWMSEGLENFKQLQKNVGNDKAFKRRAIFDCSFGTERLHKN